MMRQKAQRNWNGSYAYICMQVCMRLACVCIEDIEYRVYDENVCFQCVLVRIENVKQRTNMAMASVSYTYSMLF